MRSMQSSKTRYWLVISRAGLCFLKPETYRIGAFSFKKKNMTFSNCTNTYDHVNILLGLRRVSACKKGARGLNSSSCKVNLPSSSINPLSTQEGKQDRTSTSGTHLIWVLTDKCNQTLPVLRRCCFPKIHTSSSVSGNSSRQSAKIVIWFSYLDKTEKERNLSKM